MNLLELFDRIIDEAPVDFVGTGSGESGEREECEWRLLIDIFREQLKEFIEQNSLKGLE